MNHVMLDFETFGTKRNAVIVQVGAVFFDPVTGELGASFKMNVNPASHVQAGGVMDAETVQWWMQQSDEARASILEKGEDVTVVMNALNLFLAPAKRIWSHATFDFVLLLETLRMLKINPLFSYKAGLDIRTLTFLAGSSPSKTPREGTHHDALDDCKHQVKYCVQSLNQVKASKKLMQFIDKLEGT